MLSFHWQELVLRHISVYCEGSVIFDWIRWLSLTSNFYTAEGEHRLRMASQLCHSNNVDSNNVLISCGCCNNLLPNLTAWKAHLFLLEFWNSEIQSVFHWVKSQVSTAALSLETLRENLFACLFQLLEPHSLHSLILGLFLHLQSVATCFLPSYSQVSLFFPLTRTLVIPFRWSREFRVISPSQDT